MILGLQFNEGSLVITTDKAPRIISPTSHPMYDRIRELVKSSEGYEEAERLLDIESTIKEYVSDKMPMEDGAIFYDGRCIGNKMSQYLLRMMKEGADVAPLVKFIENLRQNPSNRAVNELYTFLDVNQLPITEDGHFLAYKFVTDDYKDCHSQTIDNSIGSIVEMDRNAVDDEKDRTCSHGLHFCSFEFVKGGWGDRWIVVKINPRDVVSIPVDYNNTKGRCCRYEVLSELDIPEDYRARRDSDKDDFRLSDSTVYYGDEDEICDECEFDVDECCCEDEEELYPGKPHDYEEDTSPVDYAELGQLHGASHRADAQRQKKSYASKYDPQYPGKPEYMVAYNTSFEGKNVEVRLDYVELGRSHGQCDRDTVKRQKKSYDSLRNHRCPDSATADEKAKYVEAYEKAFLNK